MLNYLALAGYDAEKAAAALPTVLHLAGAGGMDLATASDMVTDSMAALQMEVNQTNLDKFADQMAKTASTTNTSVSQLGEAILTVGATGANLRNGTTELNTQLGILANVGIKGAEGGTHLRNILLRLQSPTDKAAKQLNKLGIAVYDTDGKMRDTGAIFSDLKASMEGMSQSEIDQIMSTIFNKTDLAAAQALLAGAGDEYDRIFNIIENSGGAAAEMYKTMLDNLKGDVDMFSSATESLYLSLYKSINGTLRELVKTGTSYINRLTDAFNEGGFEGLATELGNVLGDAVTLIVGYAPKLVKAGVSVVSALVESIGNNADKIADAAADIAIELGGAIIKIAPKLATAFVKVIAAAGKALVGAIPKIFKSVPDSVYNALGLDKSAVVRVVSRFARNMKGAITKLFKGDLFGSIDSIGKAFNIDSGAMEKVKSIFTSIGNVLQKVWGFAQKAGSAIGSFIGKFASIGGIEATIAGLAAAFATLKAIKIGNTFINMAKGIKKAGGVMKLLAANKFLLIAAAIAAVVAGIVLLVKNWEKVKKAIGAGIDKVFGAGTFEKVSAALGKVGDAFKSVGEWGKSAFEKVKGAFTNGLGSIEGLSWSGIGQKIMAGVGNLGSWFVGLFKSGKKSTEDLTWSDVGDSVMTGVKTVIDAGGTFLSGLFSAGKTAVEAIPWGTIGTVIGDGVHGVIDVGGAFLTGGFEAAKTAIEAIDWANIGSTIGTAVNGTIDTAGAFLSGCFDTALTTINTIDWSSIGTTIGTAVNNTIDTAGAFLSGCFDTALTAINTIDWTSIGTTIGTAVNDTIDTAGAFLSGCFETAKTAIEGIEWTNIGTTIADGVNGAVDTAGAFLSGCFETAKTAIDGIDWASIGTTIATGVNGSIDTAGAFLSGCFDAAKATIDAIDWASIGTTIATGINGTIDAAGAFLSGGFEAAKASIEAIDWAGLGAKVGELTTVVASIPLDALSGVFTAADATINSIDWAGLGENVGNLLNQVTDLSADAISGVFTAAQSTIESIDWDGLGDRVANGLNRAGGILGDLGGTVLNLGELFAGGLEQATGALKDWALGTDDTSNAQAVGQQIVQDVSTGVTTETPNLVTTVDEAATQFLTAFEEKLTGEAATAIATTFISGFSTLGTDLATAFADVDLTTPITTPLADFSLEAEGTAIMGTFSAGIDAGAPTATASMTAAGEQIKTIAQSVDLTLQGTNMLRTMTNGMNSGRPAAIASATATGNSIKSTFSSINLYSIGANVVTGFKNGMQSMFSSLMATARNMAAQLKATIQSGMQVHSPSRFTEWIGNMTGEGLVNSLEGMTKKTTAAAAAMTMGITSALAPVAVAAPEVTAPSAIVQEYTATTPSATVSPYEVFATGGDSSDFSSSTNERRIVVDLQGGGRIEVNGLTKEQAIDLIFQQLKPQLQAILAEEIFTGGDEVYEF